MTPLFRFPRLGATYHPDVGVSYVVWSTANSTLDVVITPRQGPPRTIRLMPLGEACWGATDRNGKAGDRYQFKTSQGSLVSDPASRFQPDGVCGRSEVVSTTDWEWRASTWRRLPLKGRVFYELHVGTFTTEGTYAAAEARLPHLVELGVNTIELLPIAQFCGERNWGYDGVYPFAPARCYGSPTELAHFVDVAHALGLSVVLDVVYNHFGPVGCPAIAFSEHYLHASRDNPWGKALNFDGPHSRGVRELFLQNVVYWLDEYRIDGLRLDSTPSIEDESETHFLSEASHLAHERGAWLIAEDGRNLAHVARPVSEGGCGMDGIWADDFHHSIIVTLTGQNDAHFSCFDGSAEELADTIRHGWHYRGQFFKHWNQPRGSESHGLPREAFVFCISNHDQVGNRPLAERIHQRISPAAYRAVSQLLCLVPATPLLFMGQEWAASTPFHFFADLPPEIGNKLAEGRLRELTSNNTVIDEATRARMKDPQDPMTFAASILDWSELARKPHESVLRLYRDCLRLRATHPIFQAPPREEWNCTHADPDLLLIRWKDGPAEWLLVVCLAGTRALSIDLSRELLAPFPDRWALIIDSNSAHYGATSTLVSEMQGVHLLFNTPGAVLLRGTA